MATWPPSLPQKPLADAYRESAEPAVVRTPMDIGPAKIRRRYTAEVGILGVGFVLTTAQVATLETFYVTTLGSGVDAFDMAHPRTGSTVSMRFRDRPEYAAAAPGYWRTAFELEVVP